MPSFDVVSKYDMQEIDNAVNIFNSENVEQVLKKENVEYIYIDIPIFNFFN